MLKEKAVLNNELGLHARPAAVFVKKANEFQSDIKIETGGKLVDGKSIIGVMSLSAFAGEEILLLVKGPDEKEAIEELKKLLEEGLKDI